MKKYSVWIELIGIIIVGMFTCLVLYWKQAAWQEVDSALENGESSLKYYIDQVTIDNGIEISGWIYKEGENTEYFDSAIVLKNVDSGHYYEIATTFVKRIDVTETFGNSEYNYDNSGFYAKADRYSAGEEYEIYILYDKHGERILQPTGNAISLNVL